MPPFRMLSKLPTRWVRPKVTLLGLQHSRKSFLISLSSKPVTWATIPQIRLAKVPRIKKFYIVWGLQSTKMLSQHQVKRFRDSSSPVKLPSPSPWREVMITCLSLWQICSRGACKSNLILLKCRNQSPTRKRLPCTLWWIHWQLLTRELHPNLAQVHRLVSSKN